MRKIIQSKTRELNIADYKMRSASDADYAQLITGPCVIMDGATPKVVYEQIPFDTTPYKEALERIKYQQNERTAGLKTVSRIFGYSPRNVLRKDFCATTSLAAESPEEHELICELGQRVSEIYLANAPEVYEKHSGLVKEKMRIEWVIPGTPFTSGIINKNNPLKYHFDTGNFKQVFSCMVAFKKDCTGGHLALPEYDCALEIGDGSVTLFDGQEILHGVTPFKCEEGGYRYTIVFYALRGMWECMTVDEEVARIRKLKTTREKKRVTNNGTDTPTV